MANRKLSDAHRQKISESMKKHHSNIRNKGVATGQFGAQSSEYDMTANGVRSLSKSIGTDQAYQISIDVRSAITAIANNIAKMKIRVFNARSGQEVIGGPIYELFNKPSPRYSQSRWLAELASFYSLHNEVALLRDPGRMAPKSLLPLNPGKLWIEEPRPARDLSQVTQWRYHWEDGMQGMYSSDSICFDKMFNPISNVRGISPIVTGMNEIGSSYEATRYNKQFFENGAIPSHMLILPEGTPRQQRLDIENRYLAQFGLFDGGAHKVMAVSGGDVKIETLDARPKEGDFMSLIQLNTQKIAQLFKVPAIEMGIYDKTRFETSSQEREMFLDGTLVPLAERISDFLQDQVVDRWFSNSTIKTKDTKLSKSQQKAFEKAVDNNSRSSVVVMLDTDTVPIAAKIMKERIIAAAELRRSAGLSFNEAAEYLGIDLPEVRDVETYRDMVFIANSEQRIDNMLDEPKVESVEVPVAIDEPAVDGVEEEEVDKAKIKRVKNFLREIRKESLVASDKGEMLLLGDLDSMIDEHLDGSALMKRQMRLDYKPLRDAIENKDSQSVKDLFNNKNKTWIKAFCIADKG